MPKFTSKLPTPRNRQYSGQNDSEVDVRLWQGQSSRSLSSRGFSTANPSYGTLATQKSNPSLGDNPKRTNTAEEFNLEELNQIRTSTSTAAEPHPESEGSTKGTFFDSSKAPSTPISPKDAQEEKKANKDGDDPFANLPAQEAEILRRQLAISPVKVKIRDLFRFATKWDKLVIWLSILCAIVAGSARPLMSLVFGQTANLFKDYFDGTKSRHDSESDLTTFVLYYVYLGIGEFLATYATTVGFIYTGEHIAAKIREQYLAACLRQNVAFYDKFGAGEITTRITSDSNLIQDAISQKLSLTLMGLATFVAGFVVGFIKAWKLTFILTSTAFAVTMVFSVGSKFKIKNEIQSLRVYGRAGNIAEEVISSCRVVTAFSAQDAMAGKYGKLLSTAEGFGFRSRFALGGIIAGFFFVQYMNYGLAFWQGARFLVHGDINLGDIMTTVMSIMQGAFALGNVAPNIASLMTGVSSASKIYATIDRKSPIDASQDAGTKPRELEGPVSVDFRDVKHIYPSRPGVTVLEDVSLHFPAGKQTALVGASGSGKSSIISLLERFYEPVSGQVLFDGEDIKNLNLKWLRQQIALVGQEPTLFGGTILENIEHGLIGTKFEHAASEQKRILCTEAASKANAHEFIDGLPNGYQTNVGERGFLLSGGQKQRIAIARAIVSDPKVLLLDEATSALDTKSESAVQAALEVASAGRTTITIAHRLSTIRVADNIIVMSHGRVVEQGTHEKLIENKGPYYALVEAQSIAQSQESSSHNQEDTPQPDRISKDSSEEPSSIENALEKSQTVISTRKIDVATTTPSQDGTYSLWTLIKVTAAFNKPEWPYMVLGLFCSIIAGGGNPVQSVFYAKQVVSLIGYPHFEDAHQAVHKADFWSWMYFMLAFVQLGAYLGQGFAFAYCCEKLVRRVQDKAFQAIIHQDIEFFDRDENSTGALTSLLATQATSVAGLSGATLGTILSMVTTLVVVIVVTVAIGWKLALVIAATIPVLLGCGWLRFWVMWRQARASRAAYMKSANYACEATNAIRTVVSLTREHAVTRRYAADLRNQEMKDLPSTFKSSALFALAQSFIFLVMALGFWYGSKLIIDGEYSLQQFYIIFPAITFGTTAAGTLFSFAPDMGKAKEATRQLKILFDRKPIINSSSSIQSKLTESGVVGRVEFRDVHFRYPTRPEQPVLRGLDLCIEPGQFVALVGASGCGKSTTVSLLERFYDPTHGKLMLDGVDIRDLNVKDYRAHLALVSQEPTLFQGTVRQNIVLGAIGPVSDEQIEFACREANIHDFITTLPEGMETTVGNKGGMLSGGQKQRIAIARALIRQPKVLLLDEATSALDSQSEGVVQAALDKAAKGRTTIAIAHRLSTIQKADTIYVFDAGRVVEQGSHAELMNLGGRYKDMVCMQDLEERK